MRILLDEQLPRHIAWHRAARTLLGLPPAEAPYSDYISAMLACDPANVRRMLARVTAVSGRPWTTAITRQLHFSEWTLYGVFVDEVIGELKTLPGETSLLVAGLSNDGIRPVAGYNTERELAIGSAFKLYILSELVREAGAGQRKWTDVVPLDAKLTSLPSGMLQSWPADAPVTLHTLATMMISISDNTAADELLTPLGRERVEAILPETGHAKPALNMPFLSTLEMFKLKGEPTGKAATAYLALDVNGRRAFLADTIAFSLDLGYAQSPEVLHDPLYRIHHLSSVLVRGRNHE